MIAHEELLHRHNTDTPAQEVAPQMESEQLPAQEDVHVHLERDNSPREHQIEIKEGHACSADCPEHGHHDHAHDGHGHEAAHVQDHTIAQKSVEHACGADCPEHNSEHAHETGHQAHHHEDDKQHTHHIEQKPHACGADCLEHGHSHETSEHGHHHIEAKSHEHACSADCPEHNHELEQKAVAKEVEPHVPHEKVEASKQTHAEEARNEVASYHRIEEATRQASSTEAKERAITQQEESFQVEATKISEVTATAEVIDVAADQLQPEQQPMFVTSEHESASQDTLPEPELTPHQETVLREAVPSSTPASMENVTEQIVDPAPLPSLEVAASNDADADEAMSDTLFEIESNEGEIILDIDSSQAVATEMPRTEIFDQVEMVETVEPLEAIGIEPVALQLPEAMQEQEPLHVLFDVNENAPEPLSAPTVEEIVLPPSEATREQTIVSAEKTVETLAETINQRIDEVEEQITAATPKRAQEIRKSLNILTHLQATPVHERNQEAVQKRFIHLLQLLGYENPSQTFAAYIHQYGIGFTDQLLAHLLELMEQGRSFESLPGHTPPAFSAQQTTGVTVLDALVLALLGLKGHALPSRSRATLALNQSPMG